MADINMDDINCNLSEICYVLVRSPEPWNKSIDSSQSIPLNELPVEPRIMIRPSSAGQSSISTTIANTTTIGSGKGLVLCVSSLVKVLALIALPSPPIFLKS